MNHNLNLNKKLNFNYRLEDFIPCFFGFNKRVKRIAKILEKNISLEADFREYLQSREGYTKGMLFLMYHMYSSGTAVLGMGLGASYLVDHLF